MPNRYYIAGVQSASEKLAAVNPELKKFLWRLGTGVGTGALIGAAIAPEKKYRARMALYSGLADIPVLALSHTPDVVRYLKTVAPNFNRILPKMR